MRGREGEAGTGCESGDRGRGCLDLKGFWCQVRWLDRVRPRLGGQETDMCACVCVRACVRLCVCARVRAGVRVRHSVCMRACLPAWMHSCVRACEGGWGGSKEVAGTRADDAAETFTSHRTIARRGEAGNRGSARSLVTLHSDPRRAPTSKLPVILILTLPSLTPLRGVLL